MFKNLLQKFVPQEQLQQRMFKIRWETFRGLFRKMFWPNFECKPLHGMEIIQI